MAGKPLDDRTKNKAVCMPMSSLPPLRPAQKVIPKVNIREIR